MLAPCHTSSQKTTAQRRMLFFFVFTAVISFLMGCRSYRLPAAGRAPAAEKITRNRSCCPASRRRQRRGRRCRAQRDSRAAFQEVLLCDADNIAVRQGLFRYSGIHDAVFADERGGVGGVGVDPVHACGVGGEEAADGGGVASTKSLRATITPVMRRNHCPAYPTPR